MEDAATAETAVPDLYEATGCLHKTMSGHFRPSELLTLSTMKSIASVVISQFKGKWRHGSLVESMLNKEELMNFSYFGLLSPYRHHRLLNPAPGQTIRYRC
jgi:hypothetical protein